MVPLQREWRSTVTLLVTGAALLMSPLSVRAQERPDSIRAELRRLSALVDSLRQEVERLRTEGSQEEAGDALARLRAAAEAAANAGAAPAEAAGEQDFVGRQSSLQALNPEISVNADLFAHVNKDDTNAENFFAREFEVSFISNLDPYSRAKIFIGRHVPGGEIVPFGEHGEEDAHAGEDAHGGGFAVEEGYVEWLNLYGGVGVKLGRFYQQFGQLNRWHSHALGFQSRSLPSLAFIGEEPLGQTGVSLHWLAPFGGAAGTYEATFEVTRSENEMLFGESGRPSVLGNINAFWQLSEATDLDFSVSWVNGSYEDEQNFFDRNLYGAEMAFTWRPPAQARYRGFQLRAGTMILDGLVAHQDEEHDGEVEEEPDLPEQAKGFWSQAELRLSTSWLAGARYEWAENPEDPSGSAWLFSPTLTWWQSEYVRVRAEYDLLGRALEDAREGRFMIQVTFAMGPHKHATY